jgi:iron complex outermembrane receptor protein
MQLTQQVAVLGGGGATVGLVTNGGQSRSEGAELELTMRPTASLRLGATVGYTDARYTNYVDTRAGTTLTFTGNRLNFSPRMTSTLSAVYTMAVPMGALALRGDYSFVDSYFTGRENLEQRDGQALRGDARQRRLRAAGRRGHEPGGRLRTGAYLGPGGHAELLNPMA